MKMLPVKFSDVQALKIKDAVTALMLALSSRVVNAQLATTPIIFLIHCFGVTILSDLELNI